MPVSGGISGILFNTFETFLRELYHADVSSQLVT